MAKVFSVVLEISNNIGIIQYCWKLYAGPDRLPPETLCRPDGSAFFSYHDEECLPHNINVSLHGLFSGKMRRVSPPVRNILIEVAKNIIFLR